MSWGKHSGDDNQYPDLEKIFLHARNLNLLWRYQILEENSMDGTQLIEEMSDDIFWDLAEIDLEKSVTKSLRMTNLELKTLPKELPTPVTTQILDFSGNKLSEIPKEWFDHLQQLRVLRLTNNKLRSLPWEGLSKLINLQIIDLRNNNWDQEFVNKFNSFVRMFRDNKIKVYW